MEHHVHNGDAPSHGFKVGIGTLAVAAFYHELLQQPLYSLDVAACCAAWPSLTQTEASVQGLFAASDFLPTALEETRAKYVSVEQLEAQLTLLRARWPDLRERLQRQLPAVAELKQRLKLVGAPTEPEEIGISRARLRASFQRAYHIRRRFTVLDLAVRTARMEPILNSLFGPGGIWDVNVSP